MEVWKKIKEDYAYEASSLGNVRRTGSTLLRKPQLNNTGRLTVSLCKHGACKNFQVHRLVAGAFLTGRPDQIQVNHKDGVPTNNSLENLEWCTPSENLKHAYANGLKPPFSVGEDNYNAKITEEDVKEIRRRAIAGESYQSLSKEFGLHEDTTLRVATGQIWKKVDYPVAPMYRRESCLECGDKLSGKQLKYCGSRKDKTSCTYKVMQRQKKESSRKKNTIITKIKETN